MQSLSVGADIAWQDLKAEHSLLKRVLRSYGIDQTKLKINKGIPSNEAISTQRFCPGCGSSYDRKVSALLFSSMDFQDIGYPYRPCEYYKHFVLIYNEDCEKQLCKGIITTDKEYWLKPIRTNEYELVESSIDKSEQYYVDGQ